MNTEVIEQPRTNEMTAIANRINDGLAAFEERKAELTNLKQEAEGLKINSLDDKIIINTVIAIRKRLKVARIAIEKEGKSMRDPLTDLSRKISAKEKELILIIEPTEKQLLKQEEWVESEKERIRQEEEAKEKQRIQKRIDSLASFGYTIDYNLLIGLSDEDFEGVVENAKEEYEKEVARKEEEERIRLENEAREKAEREAESKRLKEERAELEKLRREQQERELKIQAEQKRIDEENERQRRTKDKARKDELINLGLNLYGAYYSLEEIRVGITQISDYTDDQFTDLIHRITPEIEAKKESFRIEQERLAKEKEQQEKQRIAQLQKEAAEKALRDKEEADRQKKAEEIERLAQASDKVKFQDLYNQLKLITIPEMKSARSRKLAAEVSEILTNAQQHIQNNVLKQKVVA